MQRKFDINQTNLTWKYCEVLWKCSFLLSFKIMLGFSRKRHTTAIYVQKYHFCKIPLYVSLLLALAPQLTNSLQVLLLFTIIIANGDICCLYDIIIIAPGDICSLYNHHCLWKYLFVKQLRHYQDENLEN